MTYNSLLQEAEDNNIEIIEFTFESDSMGMCVDNIIALSDKLDTTVEKKCILAEELGHYYTTVGNISDLRDVLNRKQERKARNWSCEKLIPLKSILKAYYNQCTNLYELAEYLDVTEKFLKDALEYYQSKYGLYKEVGNYCIYFNPLTVCKYNYRYTKEV